MFVLFSKARGLMFDVKPRKSAAFAQGRANVQIALELRKMAVLECHTSVAQQC